MSLSSFVVMLLRYQVGEHFAVIAITHSKEILHQDMS